MRTACARVKTGSRTGGARPPAGAVHRVRRESKILRPPCQQQPDREEADDRHDEADGQPASAPAATQHGELRHQRQDHEPRHLRQGGDRGRLRPPRDEPARERAVDAEVERPGEVRPADAKQHVEEGQRADERQPHRRGGRRQDGQAQDHPRAAPVQHRAQEGRGDRRQDPAQRHRPRDRRPRPAELPDHRGDEDRQHGHR